MGFSKLAAEYLDAGWPIIPILPATKAEKYRMPRGWDSDIYLPADFEHAAGIGLRLHEIPVVVFDADDIEAWLEFETLGMPDTSTLKTTRGTHWYYWLDEGDWKTLLFRGAKKPHPKLDILYGARMCVVAHVDGRTWENRPWLNEGPQTLPLGLLEPFLRPEPKRAPAPADTNPTTPGSRFNVDEDEYPWDDLLGEMGCRRINDVQWERPDQPIRGKCGLTVGYCHSQAHGGKLMHVFSTNFPPFSADTSYSKFSVFAHWHHGGDFSAAAAALSRIGFGDPIEDEFEPADFFDDHSAHSEPSTPHNDESKKPTSPDLDDILLPGFVRQFAEWFHNGTGCGMYLGALGGIAAIPPIVGKRVRTETPGNIFMLGLGDSGGGKTAVMDFIRLLYRSIECQEHWLSRVGSPQGLEKYLETCSDLVLLMDEAGDSLKVMADERQQWQNTIPAMLKDLYTASRSAYKFRALSGDTVKTIDRPNVSVLMMAIRDSAVQHFTHQSLSDGFFARICLFDIPFHRRRFGKRNYSSDVPVELRAHILPWLEYDDVEHVIALSSQARQKMGDIHDHSEHWREQGGVAGALWARHVEKVYKFALLSRLSRSNSLDDDVQAEDVERAEVIVRKCNEYALSTAENRITLNEREQEEIHRRDVVRRFIAKKDRTTFRAVNQGVWGVNAPTLRKIITELYERREIDVIREVGKLRLVGDVLDVRGSDKLVAR